MMEARLETAEREYLLQLARAAIAAQAGADPEPRVDNTRLTPALREPRGCFVTLHRAGELRGCIGNLQAREPGVPCP